MEELDAWLEAHGDEIGLGWAVGSGRPLERRLFGIALAGADGSELVRAVRPVEHRRRAAAGLVRARGPRRIGHDLKQLVTTLAADRGLELQGTFFDTLVAGYMCNPALRSQTLDDVAATRFGATLPERPLSPDTGAEEQAMARRAAGEALTALLMVPALEQELAEGGLANLFDEVEMPLLPVLARMELAGIRLDLDALAAMREEFAATLAGLESRIYELVGHEFNIGSPKQLEQILFDELGLPATKRTRTGFSTDASVLEELREQARGGRADPRASPGREAEVDLRRRAADAGGRRGPAAHDLPAGGRRDRPPLEHRSEPPEHPDPHRARPPHPARVRGARRASCCSAPTTRSRSCASSRTSPAIPGCGPTSRRTRTSTSPPPPASWAWRPSRSGRRSAAWRR